MAFNQTTTFTNGTVLSAINLRREYRFARNYLNGGIGIADVDDGTISTLDIVRGEYQGVTGDHQFTTGDMCYQTATQQANEVAFCTSHIKANDQVVPIVYQDLWKLGKRFYLEKRADAFINVYAWMYGDVNIVQPDTGDANLYYLAVDDVIENDTLCAGFDVGATAGGNIDQEGNFHARLCPIQMSHLELAMDPGWHSVQVKVNPCLELARLRARHISVEVFYK